MKNYLKRDKEISLSIFSTKTVRFMRLIIFFSFLSLMQTFGINSYSQNTKVSLNLQKATVKEVLKNIEIQSDFYFIFDEKLVNGNRVVNINVDNGSIKEVLRELFKDTNIKYLVIDNQIVLAPQNILNSEDGAINISKQKKITIKGVVRDNKGLPIPGVTIQIKGTTLGTITDLDGGYSIKVPQNAETLVFSFVGMKTQEVLINNQTNIDIVLTDNSLDIEEVVVTGYSTQRKEAISGSVATVKAEKLKSVAGSNISQKLQGAVTGVTVINSHTPGADATIMIRGLGTINNNNPLYVIDGVPVSGGLSQINPNDIEAISILKDAASASIYGARGANGVILITTKRGKKDQETSVSVSAKYGISNASNKYNLLNTQESADLLWLEFSNSNQTPSNPFFGNGTKPVIPDYITLTNGYMEGDPGANPDLYKLHSYQLAPTNKNGTDWYDAMMRTAQTQEFDINIAGGSKKINYSVSAGYRNEEGLLINTGFTRFSVRSNLDIEVNNWFKVGQTLGLTFTEGYGNQSNNNEFGIIATSFRNQPMVPIYDIKNNYAGPALNSVAILTRDKYDFSKKARPLGNFYAEFSILKDFTFKSLLGYDYNSSNNRDRELKNPENPLYHDYDYLSRVNYYSLQWNWANTLKYHHIFNEIHTVDLILGTEAVSSKGEVLRASRTDYFSDDVNYMTLDTGTDNISNAGNGYETNTFSTFARLDYDLLGKYVIQATIRRDGSSNFGQNKRYGTFPAISAGWRITNEKFMESTSKWLNYLKFRVGVGQTGNDRISNLNAYTLYTSNIERAFYSLDGNPTSTIPGFDSFTLGNPNAKWETTTTSDFGLDATIWGSVSITADYWIRNTSDMLFPVQLPATWGRVNVLPSINIGDMKNKGFDVSVGYNGKSSNFTYGVTLNISHYKNEIVKLSDNENEFIQGESWQSFIYTRTEVGHSFPEFYGYIVDGIFQTQEEADAHVPFGSYNKPGHYKFRNINSDDIINDKDRTYIGSPHPDFTGGLNMNLGYKNFGLSAFFYGSYGNDVINYVNRWTNFKLFTGNRSKERLYNSWGSPYLKNNEDALLPIAELSDTKSQLPSTAFIEDASYVRLKTLQLSFNLPKDWLDKIQLKNMRVYIQANNLFTITNYSGLDPEIGSKGMQMGIDAGAWPTAKQVLFGVDVNF